MTTEKALTPETERQIFRLAEGSWELWKNAPGYGPADLRDALLPQYRAAAVVAVEGMTGPNHPLANVYKCSGVQCQAAWIKRPIGSEAINSNEAGQHGWDYDPDRGWRCPHCRPLLPTGGGMTADAFMSKVEYELKEDCKRPDMVEFVAEICKHHEQAVAEAVAAREKELQALHLQKLDESNNHMRGRWEQRVRNEVGAERNKHAKQLQEAVAAEREKQARMREEHAEALEVFGAERERHAAELAQKKADHAKELDGLNKLLEATTDIECDKLRAELAQERSNWLDLKKRMCEAAAEQKREAVAAAYEHAAAIADEEDLRCSGLQADKLKDAVAQHYYGGAKNSARIITLEIRKNAAKPQEEGPGEQGMIWPSHAPECCCSRCEAKTATRLDVPKRHDIGYHK